MKVLGIDIGGSGMKAAIVDTETGKLLTDRHRIPTPQPSLPSAVAGVVNELVQHFDWKGPVGCCFPTIMVNGQCMHTGNLSKEWLHVQVDALFSESTNGNSFYVSNDADLAGVAEVNFGAGKGEQGKVIMITIGTGIGSGMFYEGKLIPNLELGRIFHTNGDIAERYVADSIRKKENLSLEEWAKRFDFFLQHVKTIHSPNLIILGGGISKKYDDFSEYLTVNVPIKVAKFRNNAGIIGAAMYANKRHNKR